MGKRLGRIQKMQSICTTTAGPSCRYSSKFHVENNRKRELRRGESDGGARGHAPVAVTVRSVGARVAPRSATLPAPPPSDGCAVHGGDRVSSPKTPQTNLPHFSLLRLPPATRPQFPVFLSPLHFLPSRFSLSHPICICLSPLFFSFSTFLLVPRFVFFLFLRGGSGGVVAVGRAIRGDLASLIRLRCWCLRGEGYGGAGAGAAGEDEHHELAAVQQRPLLQLQQPQGRRCRPSTSSISPS